MSYTKELEILERALKKLKEVDFLDLFYTEQIDLFNTIDKDDRFKLMFFNNILKAIFKHVLSVYSDLESYKEELEEKKTKTNEHIIILNKLNKYFLKLELENNLKNKETTSKKLNKL